jgi:hypothetical protein
MLFVTPDLLSDAVSEFLFYPKMVGVWQLVSLLKSRDLLSINPASARLSVLHLQLVHHVGNKQWVVSHFFYCSISQHACYETENIPVERCSNDPTYEGYIQQALLDVETAQNTDSTMPADLGRDEEQVHEDLSLPPVSHDPLQAPVLNSMAFLSSYQTHTTYTHQFLQPFATNCY